MTIDHERARRIADGWASAPDDHYPPAGELARAYLDLLAKQGADEQPHHRALREMKKVK